MTGSAIIDVVIGLVFFYLIYSLLATIIQEITATFWEFRSKMLERAIRRMLLDDDSHNNNRVVSVWKLFFANKETDTLKQQMISRKAKSREVSQEDEQLMEQGFFASFYHHPLIKYLGESRKGAKPSYLSPDSFAKVILDLLQGKDLNPGENISDKINTALNGGFTNWEFDFGTSKIPPQTLSFIRSLWVDAKGDVAKFRSLLEHWFDDTMERTTGWYKKHTQLVLLCIGFLLSVGFNLDTFKVVNQLNTDPKLRAEVVQQAQSFLQQHPDLPNELATQKKEINVKFKADSTTNKDSLSKAAELAYQQNKATRDTLLARASTLLNGDISKLQKGLALGPAEYSGGWPFLKMLIGWLITALAISLGAPFWFDILNRVMQLRSSVSGFQTKKQETVKQDSVNNNGIKPVG